MVKERLLDLLSREEEEESHGEDVVRRGTRDPRAPGSGGGGKGVCAFWGGLETVTSSMSE